MFTLAGGGSSAVNSVPDRDALLRVEESGEPEDLLGDGGRVYQTELVHGVGQRCKGAQGGAVHEPNDDEIDVQATRPCGGTDDQPLEGTGVGDIDLSGDEHGPRPDRPELDA